MLYKCYAKSVFAYVFHELWPSQNFRVRPKYLGSVVTMMQYLRISYSRWKDMYEALVATKDQLEYDMRTVVENIEILIKFYIPSVLLSFVMHRLLLHSH